MTTWPQDYDPLHAWPLSTAVAALPVLTLFFALLVLRARVWAAALAGAVAAVALALVVFGMPATLVGGAFALGVQFGLWRIAWIIVASIFLYEVAVETGQFRVMKESIAALSSDRRLQLILVAFCFGAFLEGTGGGEGMPGGDARARSLDRPLGFDPVPGGHALPGRQHRRPVAWGGGRQPDPGARGGDGPARDGPQCHDGPHPPPVSAILPFWLVRSLVGWRDVRRLAGPGLVSGLSFAGAQFYWSNYRENGLVDVVAALASLLTMVARS